MISTLRASAIALTLAIIPAVALAQVTGGTTLSGTLDQTLSSANAQVGQTFTISNAHSSNYNINGATIYGHVVSVQHAGQGTPGKLELVIDKVNTRSGNVYAATGYVSDAQMTTKKNTTNEVVGAVAGGIVGSLLGHGGGGKTFGTLAGAAGGYLYAKNARQNVSMASGTNVSVALSTARRQSSIYHRR